MAPAPRYASGSHARRPDQDTWDTMDDHPRRQKLRELRLRLSPAVADDQVFAPREASFKPKSRLLMALDLADREVRLGVARPAVTFKGPRKMKR